MSRGRFVLGWAIVVVLALWSQSIWNTRAASREAPEQSSFTSRLLGPVSSLAASVQLVRADQALRAGRPGLGYARVADAIALDPGAPEVWSFLAYHLVFERGSSSREPDPKKRLSWIREGLDVLERGEDRSRHPERLAFERGLILSAMATLAAVPDTASGNGALPWPGGPRAAWRASAEAFERAAAAGHPTAEGFARRARDRSLN